MYVCMYVCTKKQVEQEANQVPSKMKTTYGRKKTKNYTTKTVLRTTYGG